MIRIYDRSSYHRLPVPVIIREHGQYSTIISYDTGYGTYVTVLRTVPGYVQYYSQKTPKYHSIIR